MPTDEGWQLTAMLGRWAVAADRRPVHEVSGRNRWDRPFTPELPGPLWTGPEATGR
ncbi:hypothetical protein [Kutzneria sp. NPDC052558]|uniref:hypothetical protein n=1 Tax=Kutzneria sp. NPDC052558 TaxID=3364121 RepID=UPI0037CA7116